MTEYCEFQIDHGFYAVPMEAVREVLQKQNLSPVPLAPPLLCGMTCFRGDVLPVFEIKSLLSNEATPGPAASRARLLVLAQGDTLIGLQVDQISRITAPENSTPEIPQNPPPLWSLLQTQGGSRNLRLIHLDRLISVLNSQLLEHA